MRDLRHLLGRIHVQKTALDCWAGFSAECPGVQLLPTLSKQCIGHEVLGTYSSVIPKDPGSAGQIESEIFFLSCNIKQEKHTHGLLCVLEIFLQLSEAKPSDHYALVSLHREGVTSCSRNVLVPRLDSSCTLLFHGSMNYKSN